VAYERSCIYERREVSAIILRLPGVDEMNMDIGASEVCERGPLAEEVSKPTSRYLRFGGFQLDRQRQELWKGGDQVKIQGKVYQALLALLESPGDIVTREMLRKHLWPRDSGLNYDANVNTTVNKLRGLLGDTDDEPKFIETIPRRGYSFVAKVEYLDEAPAAAIDGIDTRAEKGSGVVQPATPAIFNSDHARVWFTAGVVALVIAAMLFGAAITLYSHHKPF
jgi:DNA-binding winged helix-turn-helix (wHTH) protein